MKSLPVRITLVHWFGVLMLVGFQPMKLSYWDSGWYRGLVNVGYSSTFPDGQGNVGFFPGFPLVARIFKAVLGLGSDFVSTDYAMLATALTFAFLIWKLLKDWFELNGQSEGVRQTKLILFALYPFSFFFYAAYSESLFTSLVVGFVLFSEKWIRAPDSKPALKWLGLILLCGFMMCFTRLLGLTFIAYPVFRAIQSRTRIIPALLASLLSSFGCVSFFWYCREKFGAWDFYFQSERAIWGTYFDWHKLLPPTSLFHFLPPFSGDSIGKWVTVIFGFYLTRKLWKLLQAKSFREPVLALVLVCGMYWGANLLGRTSWNYVGMGRYLLPAIALMLPFMLIPEKLNRMWWVIALIFLALQVGYVITFAHQGWVA